MTNLLEELVFSPDHLLIHFMDSEYCQELLHSHSLIIEDFVAIDSFHTSVEKFIEEYPSFHTIEKGF